MARGTTRQAVDSASTARGNLTNGQQRPGTVQQAAHDLRQPVAAVLALASAALAGEPVPDRVEHRLDQIMTHWLSKIINDMLAEPGVPPSAEAVDIVSLVRHTVRSEQLICAAQISLQQSDQEPRYLMAAGTRLRRALANVLANATRAAGPDGHVKLVERAAGNAELIEVIDDGPGFGSMAAGSRTGIGLQITGQMLAECGGRMEVERLSSGETLVRMLLPVMADGPMADGRMAGDNR
jgi:signal transduction histidine kinase